MAFLGAPRAGSWLLNLNNSGTSMFDHATRPAEFFGFSIAGYGHGSASQGWSYAGIRIRKPPEFQSRGGRWHAGSMDPSTGRGRGGQFKGNIRNTGRWWIHDVDKAGNLSKKVGRWGTFGELRSTAAATGRAIGGAKGAFTSAKMIGGRFGLPLLAGAFIGMTYLRKRNEGYGILKSAAGALIEEGAIAIGMRLALPLLANPLTWPVLAVGAIGMGYMMHRDKAARFGRNVKKTEFVGDMSAFQTNAAVTMRQRSMQSIQRSFLNARTALGNEARYQHMGGAY